MKRSISPLLQIIRSKAFSRSQQKKPLSEKYQGGFQDKGKQNFRLGFTFNQKQNRQNDVEKKQPSHLKQKLQSNFRLSLTNKKKLVLKTRTKSQIHTAVQLNMEKVKIPLKQMLNMTQQEQFLPKSNILKNGPGNFVIINRKTTFQVAQVQNLARSSKQIKNMKNHHGRQSLNRRNYKPVQQNNINIVYYKQCLKQNTLQWKNQIYRNNCKQTVRGKLFQIVNQFSLSISQHDSNKKFIGISTQTSDQSFGDKFFMEFVKNNKLKKNYFEDLQQKYQKIKQIIKQGQDFNNNYNQLISYISNMPQNGRQQGVFALSKSLQAEEQRVNNTFLKFINFTQSQQNDHSNKFKQSRKIVKNLDISIYNLLDLCLKQFDRTEPNHKYSRIVKRIIENYKLKVNISDIMTNQSIQLFVNLKSNTLQFYKDYRIWTDLLFQNRVLLYNFLKQVETLPTLTILMFGQQQKQFSNAFDQVQSMEEKMQKYMSIKCKQCYDFKQKVKLIQQKNRQIKPIIKSLQWLLRDGNKKKNILSMI